MSESRLEYALAYAKLGWLVHPVFSIGDDGNCRCGRPCKKPGKHPMTEWMKEASNDPAKITLWFQKWPHANIGIVTGEVSGIFALDIDLKTGGEDSLDTIESKHGRVPDDVLAVTGSGGKHFIFKYPGKLGGTTTNLWPGIDTRGDGGYIVVAPSNHVSGGVYFWDAEADPLAGAEPAYTPEWLLQKLRDKNQPARQGQAPTTAKSLPRDEIKRVRVALGYIPADDRDTWRNVGMALHATCAGDQAFGLWCEWSQQSDKFDLKDQRRVWESFKPGGGITLATLFSMAKTNGWVAPEPVRQAEPCLAAIIPTAFNVPALPGTDARDGTANTRALTEQGNAWRLCDAHEGNIFYIPEVKSWLFWGGCSWQWDFDGALIRQLAAKLPKQIYDEGGDHLANAELFAKWARSSQTARIIESTVGLLKDFAQVRLPLSAVDSDPFIIGIDNANQVLDLRSGLVRKAKQSDFITKALNVDLLGDPSKARRWLEFLAQVFGDDVELIDWLKRWCGYLLTGSTSEEVFVFCFGLGANGKSVLAEIIRSIMGDYARAISADTLTESKRQAGSATPDLFALIGARLALSAETEDGAALAESLIKSMVSGDAMTGRKLYGDEVQFVPQFKLMMLGNHKPVIRGNDFGIWRRVRLIPFRRTFKAEERDSGLRVKLRSEAPHILAWMVEGCLDWKLRGLRDVPAAIAAATGSYQEEQDLIGAWLTECCQLAPTTETPTKEIYNNYKVWAFDNGLRPVSNVALSRKLSERGFSYRKTNGKSLWRGLYIACSDYPDDYPYQQKSG